MAGVLEGARRTTIFLARSPRGSLNTSKPTQKASTTYTPHSGCRAQPGPQPASLANGERGCACDSDTLGAAGGFGSREDATAANGWHTVRRLRRQQSGVDGGVVRLARGGRHAKGGRDQQGPAGTHELWTHRSPGITPRAGRRLFLGSGTTSKPQARLLGLDGGRPRPLLVRRWRERHGGARSPQAQKSGQRELPGYKRATAEEAERERELHAAHNPRLLSTLFHLHSTDDRPATADRHPPATRRRARKARLAVFIASLRHP